MKTSLIIAALAAVLITGSTVSSQAIPAAPLSKSLQHNNSSLVENVLIRRGYRGFGVYRVSACWNSSGLPARRSLPGLPAFRLLRI